MEMDTRGDVSRKQNVGVAWLIDLGTVRLKPDTTYEQTRANLRTSGSV
jgi:hypothetical protein